MRMGNSLLGVWVLLSSAVAWAQGAPRDPKEEKQEPETKAYYLIARDGEDIGWFSTEVGLDERARIKITRIQQAPQDAVLDVGAFLPPPSAESETPQVEVVRTLILSAEHKMLEDHIKITSSQDDLQADAVYENGRWNTEVRVRGVAPKPIRSAESPPDDPPLLDFLYYAARSGALKLNEPVTYSIYDVDKSGAPARLEFKGTVKEKGTRPGFDGTDGEYLMMEAVFTAPDGGERSIRMFFTTADGFLDEMETGGLRFKRVTKEVLGSVAGWLAAGRRDVFESSLAEKNISESESEDTGKEVTPKDIKDELARIRDGVGVLQATPDPLKQLDLGRSLLERLNKVAERKEIAKMPNVQADINALRDAIIRAFPRESLVDLAEAQIISKQIEEDLSKDTRDAVQKADKKLDALKAIAERKTMKGSPEEPKMKDLIQLANFAIGKTVLFEYIKGFEVRGLIYRRVDQPDQVRFTGSLLGVPMTLNESVHVLRPRGLCLLTSRGKTKTYREGDILETASELVIRVKSVLEDRVILEGRGAEVELKYPPQDETARD